MGRPERGDPKDRLLAVAHELDRQARRLAAGADDDSAARPGRKSIAGRVPSVRRISRNAPSGGQRSGASL